MYEGHFPPLGHEEMLRPPPFSFRDRADRPIDVRAYGDGPVDDEYEALVGMYLAFDPSFRTLGVPPATEERIRAWLDRLLDGVCALAWHDERVVGHAVLVEEEPGDCELAIFVHQDYHGVGVGTRLLEGLLTLGRERGVDHVWLLVERTNRPAVALYNDVGFVVTDDYGGDVEMALAM